MSALMEPITLGDGTPLRNRIVMGAMTRNRCVDDLKPGPSHVRHYADRARNGAGLIIAEGTFIDWNGTDWQFAPVMIHDEHAEAWRKVVDAVHDEGGKMFFQPWHPGRVQHDEMPHLKRHNRPVLAPSAIKAQGGKYRDLPGAPEHTDSLEVIEDPRSVLGMYRNAVTLAKKAGFDGVEILAQGGYLPHQFLSSRANQRTDSYGGSVQNRCRFLLELVDVVGQIFKPGLICVKICPVDTANDSVVTFEESTETYSYLILELVKRKVGIINISRRGAFPEDGSASAIGDVSRPDGFPLPDGYDPVLHLGPLVKFPGSPSLLMANHCYTSEEANLLVKGNKLDLVTFARPFIYNPDLVARISQDVPLATNDRDDTVFHGPYKSPDENYNDWPAATV